MESPFIGKSGKIPADPLGSLAMLGVRIGFFVQTSSIGRWRGAPVGEGSGVNWEKA